MVRFFIKIFFFFPLLLFSQIDNTSFNALNLHSSSRILSLGGELISVIDDDVSLAANTPSLLNELMHNQVSFNFVDYVSDVNLISAYSASILPNDFIVFYGIDAINYGEFNHTNDLGDLISTFSANEQLLTLGFSKKIYKNITLGSNIKLLNSSLERYNAMSISSNISATYYFKEKDFSATFLFKNIGRPLKSYTSEIEELPFEIQFGISKYLDHLPFRYSLVFHHLNTFDISNDFYPETIYDPSTNSLIIKEEILFKKLLRHVIIGGELNPFRKNFFLRAGFNFQNREDLNPSSFFSMTGFTTGFGFEIKKIQINYSRRSLHGPSSINSFSIITNLSNFGL